MTAGAPTAAPANAALSLARALDEAGLRCDVAARGRLAVVAMSDAAPLVDPATRRRVTALAVACGFTHVALELDPRSEDREALRRS